LPKRVTCTPRLPLLVEILAVTLLSWAVTLLALLGGRSSLLPASAAPLLALAPLIYFPLGLLLYRGEPLAAYGVTLSHPWRALALTALAIVVLFPPFALASHVYRQVFLPFDARPGRTPFAWIDWLSEAPQAGSWLFQAFFWQFCFVALAEEFFYRGYLQGRLNLVLGGRRQVFGAPVGAALPIGSALFALHHLLVGSVPQDLLVFFPALAFGWLREVTGSLLAPALFHAACNVFANLLTRTPPA
jgi:CAAX protease family protein